MPTRKVPLLDGVGKKVGALIDSVPEGKPWFLYFGFQQPHRRWGKDHEGIDPAKLVLPPDWPDLPEVRLDYARYLAELRDLDRGVGLILDELKARQLDQDTIVIFMGDNGEALLRGKGTLATRGIHVPLLIRWPGVIKPGRVSDALISGVDLAPTILAAAGLEAAEGMTGVSFLPELKGEDFDGRHYVFAERGWHWGPLTRSDGFDLLRSVTSRRYHFVYNAIPEREYCPVDMDRPWLTAWKEVRDAHAEGTLSELHDRLYFKLPRPIFRTIRSAGGSVPTKELGRKQGCRRDRAGTANPDGSLDGAGKRLPAPAVTRSRSLIRPPDCRTAPFALEEPRLGKFALHFRGDLPLQRLLQRGLQQDDEASPELPLRHGSWPGAQLRRCPLRIPLLKNPEWMLFGSHFVLLAMSTTMAALRRAAERLTSSEPSLLGASRTKGVRAAVELSADGPDPSPRLGDSGLGSKLS